MGQKTRNRDYYTPNPAQGPHSYQQEVKKLKEKEHTPPLHGPKPKTPPHHLVYAGDRLKKATALECEECDARYGFVTGTEVPRCMMCGSETFRVVS